MYTKAPIVAAVVYDWTGFYIGGNAGYSWGAQRPTAT
jgi:outer membrane immunogenic protein